MTSSPLLQHQNHLHSKYHQYHKQISFDQLDNNGSKKITASCNIIDSTTALATSSIGSNVSQQPIGPNNSINSIKATNFEIKESASLAFNRINGGTPKRRLSYTSNNNSPIPMNINSSNNKINRQISNFSNSNSNENIQMVSSSSSSINNENSETNTTPFIKRKCLNKDQSIRLTQLAYRSNNQVSNSSPYSISSVNLANLDVISANNSKTHLDDSFETLQLTNESLSVKKETSKNSTIKTSRYQSRRSSQGSSFFKHKSAPLTNLKLSPQFSVNMLNDSSSRNILNESNALNDISNQMQSKQLLNNQIFYSSAAYKQVTFKLSDNLDLMNEEKDTNKNDDVSFLENLIFGNDNQQQVCEHQSVIEKSLEIDAKYQNLIGDRSKEHILPTIVSQKHQDLNCISPETLVDVLNGNYSEQICDCIIIDSRYPYEYEGGHIATALNIFTQDKLGEEMFIKRLNIKSSSTNKFHRSDTASQFKQGNHTENNSLLSLSNALNHSKSTSDMDWTQNNVRNEVSMSENMNDTKNNNNNKRRIVIFHCEFSSERGPSLLRFLRNLDRNLNENSYPNLYYPELYLLEGGYKSFYENFMDYCYPQTYKPMLHAEHKDDLRHFRAKAKSWEVSGYQILSRCNEHLNRNANLFQENTNQINEDQKCVMISYDNTNSSNSKYGPKTNEVHKVIKMKSNFTSTTNTTCTNSTNNII